MIIVVATVTLHPGMADRFEDVCREFMPMIRAANPDIVFYEGGRSEDEADTYRMIEVYRDKSAMERHMQSALLAEAVAALRECVAAMDVRRHDAIA